MFIRKSFEEGGRATNTILEKYAPSNITSRMNIQYRPSDSDAYFDVYYASHSAGVAPTILWVHGGGWLAGNAHDLSPWARVLAGRGFNVVALNYSLAPEHHYPLPPVQANASLHYLNDHADDLNINLNKLVLAGDSTGSQIAAQAALIETNPTYAKNVGMTPGLTRGRIAALLLNCGAYDMSLVSPDSTSDGAKLIRTFLWAYAGDKNFATSSDAKYVSIPPYVTPQFPPTFITAGNVDPLLPHSLSLAKALKKNNVTTDALFYPSNYTPALNHEYQFNLDTKEGKMALDRMMTFARCQTGGC